MGKNYEVLKHIKMQLSDYDDAISNAIQRLFNVEDQRKECMGCVIDSVVAALIFKKYGVEAQIHLGEVCADGKQDAYHCWLTIDNKILDIGIYGNSQYNSYFKGEKLKQPIILEDPGVIKYADGSTEDNTWLSQLSKMPISEYIKRCPQNRVVKLFCQSLDIIENKENQDMIYELSKDMCFPELERISMSPSGRRGLW